jgi:hypothetical protein
VSQLFRKPKVLSQCGCRRLKKQSSRRHRCQRNDTSVGSWTRNPPSTGLQAGSCARHHNTFEPRARSSNRARPTKTTTCKKSAERGVALAQGGTRSNPEWHFRCKVHCAGLLFGGRPQNSILEWRIDDAYKSRCYLECKRKPNFRTSDRYLSQSEYGSESAASGISRNYGGEF